MKKLLAAVALTVIIGAITVTGMTMQSTGEQNEEMMTGRSLFNYAAATGNIEPVSEGIPVTPRLLEHGEWVFRGMCIGCHGIDGDGNGAVWELGALYAKEHVLPRKPRDFTEAVYKLRSTPSGSLPTDKDLFTSISRGLVLNQDMPAFQYLPERDRWAVVAYIKTFSDRWEEEAEWQEDPIEISEPPLPTAESVEAGKEVYKLMQCEQCHGPTGKGDGPSAPGLEDDAGLPIIPRDFSPASPFRLIHHELQHSVRHPFELERMSQPDLRVSAPCDNCILHSLVRSARDRAHTVASNNYDLFQCQLDSYRGKEFHNQLVHRPWFLE